MSTKRIRLVKGSRFEWWHWVASLEENEDPGGRLVHEVKQVEEPVSQLLTHRFGCELHEAGIRFVGNEPVFLRHESEDQAWFRLTPPCVVWCWYQDQKDRLKIGAVCVATEADQAEAKRRVANQGRETPSFLTRASSVPFLTNHELLQLSSLYRRKGKDG